MLHEIGGIKMFQGKMKALTFSYDDGVVQDRRLVELFNKYNLKATFNLNSGLFNRENSIQVGGITVDHSKISDTEVRDLYLGHEVAAHTSHHPSLPTLEDRDVILQVEEDRKRLSELAGYEVCGMAYPGGGVNNDERVAALIQRHTGIKYARTIKSTCNFDVQSNLYRFNPTIYHRDWDNMENLVRTFIDLKPEQPTIFYIWGHSYEFDAKDEWALFEEYCKALSRRDDIFYGTNREILL